MTAIARVETWPVNVPLKAPYLMAPGVYPGMSRTIVRVTTVDGVVGLGEGGDPGDAKVIAALPFVGRDTDELRRALVQEVRHDIGALAAPDKIQFTPSLPKTRSGKIMRRILRKIADGASDGFGDTSTLADPSVVDALLTGRQ